MGTRSSYDTSPTRYSRKRGSSSPEKLSGIQRRWRNRRWMAWITFCFDHIIILYIIFYTPSVEAYEGIINTFFMLSGAVLGAYIGFSTFDDVKNREFNGINSDGGEYNPPPEAQADIDER